MFRTLVKHFARRLVQSGSEDSGDLDMSLGAMLALLASPGVFVAIGLLDKYSSLLRYFRGKPVFADHYPRAVGDGYMLLVFSMAVTGLVTLWKWDRILPDMTDRLNLGPLPIGARQTFFASLAAIGLVVGVFIIDVNAGSMFVFPMVVTAESHGIGPFAALVLAHVLALVLASVFTFCLCFSTMGLLIAAAPPRWFGGLSILLRSAMGIALLAMWMTSSKGHVWLRMTREGTATWQTWYPPLWFASLYGPLIGREDLAVAVLWQRALWALLVTGLVALAGYVIGYRRGIDGRLVRSSQRRRWPGWLLSFGKTPLERAAFRFSMQTLWRSERHSLLVIALLGAGLVAGVMYGDANRVPFFAGFSLVLAIRTAFGVAALPAANWPFRLLAVVEGDEPVRVARRLLWLHFGVLVVLPVVALCPLAVTLALVLIHAVLIEALLLGFRQIPFTVRPAGFRNTRLVHALMALVGLLFVPWAGGWIAAWIGGQPLRAIVPLAATAVLFYYRPMAAEAVEAGRARLVFEDREEDLIRLRL
ncbi:MAG: hypothetical protein HYX27_12250 [Acidobacteria bacterium]|nr:hypothetical protein [Acidobacteriota bacterium]